MTKIQNFLIFLALFATIVGVVPMVSEAQNYGGEASTGSELRAGMPPLPRCVRFDVDMRYGTSDSSGGGSVYSLQNWLSENGYLSVTPTGYYGNLTREGVRRFQRDAGLPATGYFGSMTRAEVARRSCGGGTTERKARFSAQPTSGKAPLVVTFSARTGTNRGTGDYYIDFGDGTAMRQMEGFAGICKINAGGPCNGGDNMAVTYTYEKSGTYTATLNELYDACPPGSECLSMHSMAVGSVTISVSEQTTSDLRIRVRADQSSYEEGEPVTVKITARNRTSRSQTLSFPSGCQATYDISASDGTVLYNANQNRDCSMAATSVTIPARSSYTWTIAHDAESYPLGPGIYTITGKVFGYGSAKTMIEVESDD